MKEVEGFGKTSTGGWSLNNLGQMVGHGGGWWISETAFWTSMEYLSKFNERSANYVYNKIFSNAFFWENGSLARLSTKFRLDTDYSISLTQDLNDRGQIIGHGFQISSGKSNAVLLTPVSE